MIGLSPCDLRRHEDRSQTADPSASLGMTINLYLSSRALHLSSVLNIVCHPDQGEAERRDLRFLPLAGRAAIVAIYFPNSFSTISGAILSGGVVRCVAPQSPCHFLSTRNLVKFPLDGVAQQATSFSLLRNA